MEQLMTIRLNRQDAQPWGFRLQGGSDFGTPLLVQKVNHGSLAAAAGLIPGDAVLRINNVDVLHLRHKDAQDLVVRSGNNFDLTVTRGGSTWRPQVLPTGQLPTHSPYLGNQINPVTRTSLAHRQPQEVEHIGCGYNNAARPFGGVNGSDGQVKSIVNKQYNTPVGIYSDQSIAETLSAQAEVLAGGVLGVNFKKNEKIYNGANSEVLKMLNEQATDPSEPEPYAPANFYWTASHAIGGRKSPIPRTLSSNHEDNDDERIGTHLQQNSLAPDAAHRPSLPKSQNNEIQIQEHQSQQYESQQVSKTFSSEQNISKTFSSEHLVSKNQLSQTNANQATGGTSSRACAECGATIFGVFVRIKDKNLHNECFKCATCGTSLKNQGYFNFNNKLYCDVHARLAALQNPPPGTDGYTPVPIKPCARISANTISSALNAHVGPQTNGTGPQSPSRNVNTGYGGPRPFNSGPMSPPMGSARSPGSYPPPSQNQSWAQQRPMQKPAVNPYATLPRTTGQSQGRFNTNKPGFNTYNKGGSGDITNKLNQQQQQLINNNNNTYKPTPSMGPAGFKPPPPPPSNISPSVIVSDPSPASAGPNKGGVFGATSAPKRGRGILNKAVGPGARVPLCGCCNAQIRGPFITALGRIWCPDHFVCVNGNCRRALQDIGFVEEKGDLYCEYCFEKFLAPTCNKCNSKIKGDCLNAIGKHYHPECFTCTYCGKLFGNSPFFLEEGEPYCEADWNELFTTKCFACGFPVEAGDRWVEALNHNYHSQCFNCTMCKKNLEGQTFYNKGGRPFCKNHAR